MIELTENCKQVRPAPAADTPGQHVHWALGTIGGEREGSELSISNVPSVNESCR